MRKLSASQHHKSVANLCSHHSDNWLDDSFLVNPQLHFQQQEFKIRSYNLRKTSSLMVLPHLKDKNQENSKDMVSRHILVRRYRHKFCRSKIFSS